LVAGALFSVFIAAIVLFGFEFFTARCISPINYSFYTAGGTDSVAHQPCLSLSFEKHVAFLASHFLVNVLHPFVCFLL
jgi:hypothetical protein